MEAFEKQKFVMTSEVQIPLGDEEPQTLLENLGSMSVAEIGFEGLVTDTIKSCDLLKQNNLNPIYQTTTRDKNRYQLQKVLIQAHEAGVKDLLVFTEDYRIAGDTLQESMFFHVDSGKLASVMDHLREGKTIEGNELDNPIDFTLGVGVQTPWGKSMPKKGMEEMEDMMGVGTAYFLTTPIFDVDQFDRFMKQVEPFKVPVIAEVMILRTAGMGKFLNRHFKSGLIPEWVIQKLMSAEDKQKASVELFSDTVNSLKDICQGVHIITIGGLDNLLPYLNAAQLR
jgi:5,10-methylenetetrahydrofolate reductase